MSDKAKSADGKVSTAELMRNFGPLADKALTEPVTITKNGRDRLVLLSVEEYARLKRRDRQVIAPGQLTAKERAAMAEAEVPVEHLRFDDELKDWKP
jgi:prevent-host-death family protein